MSKILYLEPDEEITSIVSRIKDLKDKDFFIVAPRGAKLTQSLVNLKLLKKEATKGKIKINLISGDVSARNLASSIGMANYSKIDKKLIKDEPEITDYFQNKEDEPKNQEETINDDIKNQDSKSVKPEALQSNVDNQKKPEVSKRDIKDFKDASALKEPERVSSPIKSQEFKPAFLSSTKKRMKKMILIGAVFVTILAASFTIFLILPKATINLLVKAERIDGSFDLEIDKSAAGVNLENNVVSGEPLSAEMSDQKTANATGIKDIGTYAKGQITITNKTGVVRSFAQGIVFATSGLNYLLDTAASVPAATLDEHGNPVYGTKAVAVTASQTGENFNIGPAGFVISGLSGDLVTKITATSAGAMAGGLKKQVKVVSQHDIDTITKELSDDLTGKAKKELLSKANKNQKIIDSAVIIETTENTLSPKLNQEASTFTLKLKIKATTLAIKNKDFEDLVKANFEKSVSDQDKVLVSSDYSGLKNKLLKNEFTKDGKIQCEIYGQMWAAAKFDNTQIQDKISGKSKSDTLTYFKGDKQIEKSEVILWPIWVKKVPQFNRAIKINIQYTQTDAKENQTDTQNPENKPLTSQ